MSSRTTLGVPALLATLLTALAITPSTVRADPPAAAAAADSCVTQPNGPAPAGHHWYYRIERASGRHCWRVLATIAGNADRKIGQGEHAATRSVPTPAGRPAALPPPDALASAGDNGPSAAAPVLAAASPQADWPTAPTQVDAPPAQPAAPPPAQPAAPPAAQPAATAPAEAAPPTAIDSAPPAGDANQDATDTRPPPPAPIVAQGPPAARPVTSMIDPAHVPALLGTALVLAFIIVASIAARLAGGFLRRRQHRCTVSEVSPNWDELFADTAAPDITALPTVRRRDRATEPEPGEGMRIAPPAREIRHRLDRKTLESNVRELLYRLQSDINSKLAGVDGRTLSTEIEPEAPMAPTDSPPSALVSGDLEAALAVWSGKKTVTRH